MNIIAFAASNSQKSINKKLVTYAASFAENHNVEVLDLNDYPLPLFSEDQEAEIGQPEEAKQFLQKIAHADAVIISFAEHNGSYTVAYKNLFDWCSRISQKVFSNKKIIALSTSPGGGGAKNVLASAVASMPHFGGDVVGSFSLPSFYDNFDLENGTIKDHSFDTSLKALIHSL